MYNFGKTIFFFVFIAFVVLFELKADAVNWDIPSHVRIELARERGASPLVYYFSKPELAEKPYPILILCDGSTSKDLRSAFYIWNYFFDKIQSLQVGYLTAENWGIDGNRTNEEAFWTHYTRSQRLEDHLKIIRYLEENPPLGWNGKFIFIGVSEGGPLVTDLSILCPNTLATVNWVGAGDWSWSDELWAWKQSSIWMRLYDALPRWIPFSSDIPATRKEYDALVQQIIENPTPNLSMAGMTYLYHADAFLKPPIDYTKIHSPFLVVGGTEDSIISSCDQFVQKAREARVPITYFRVDGMDHWIRKRPDVIEQSFEWLKFHLVSVEESQEGKI